MVEGQKIKGVAFVFGRIRGGDQNGELNLQERGRSVRNLPGIGNEATPHVGNERIPSIATLLSDRILLIRYFRRDLDRVRHEEEVAGGVGVIGDECLAVVEGGDVVHHGVWARKRIV